MKFSHFIKKHEKEITEEWVSYAQHNIDGVQDMTLVEVRDHIKEMLARIVENMETLETDDEQEDKSKGNKNLSSKDSKAADQHGAQRADVGFDIMDLSSEFRALRASIFRLWEADKETEKLEIDYEQLIRFNEAIDELWMISLKRFQYKTDESRNWYMGILGHDLRNPLAAISGVQSIFKMSSNLSDDQMMLLGLAGSSVKRMTELIDNLLELTNLRLGSGMSIKKSAADLSAQTQKIVQEIQLGYPDAHLVLKTPGPIQGKWDVARLDQMMTNLITNALRHGEPGGPVTVSVSAKENGACFKVHNEGMPLPKHIKTMIASGVFTKTEGDPTKNDSYGLGLYIVKTIVDGHKGQLHISSTKKHGTTFKITLPRG